MIKFLSLLVIIGAALCNSYAEEDEKKVIADAVLRLNLRQKELAKILPPQKTWSRMDCYIRCVKMVDSCCRVKMTGAKKKNTFGMYYAACPKKCNYKNVKNKPEKHRKKIEGCTHYDKDGYWFVTFVCNEHKNHWYFNQVKEYDRLERNCPNFEVLRMEYFKNIRKIKELKQQL